MNILSLCSVITAILYSIMFIKRIPNCKNDNLLKVSLAVFFCLGWWAFCDAFFYVAETREQAWFWLHIGAVGWNGFIPATSYYFVVMSGDDKYLDTWIKKIAYWLPGMIITLLFIWKDSAVFADNLVQSKSGLGWTYQQSFATLWPVLLFLELGLYLGSALLRLYFWQRRMEGEDVHLLSKEFILLDVTAVAVGVIVIFVIPCITSFLPPLSFLATLIFLIGYQREILSHDLLHIELALDPGSIFESSMDAMLITNASWQILYANQEAKRILKNEYLKGICFLEDLPSEGREALQNFAASGKVRSGSMDLILTNHIPLLCAVSRTSTRKQAHPVFLVFLHDASALREAQNRLDYLAHYDELTGLPNRRKLGEFLDRWEKSCQETGVDFAILFLDLNHFKRINDVYGHASGDLALKEVANAIRKCIPYKDQAARLAGDEFIILHKIEIMPPEELAEILKESIWQIDCTSFAPENHLDVSIGFCRFSETGSVRELFKLADERMYDVKKQTKMERMR